VLLFSILQGIELLKGNVSYIMSTSFGLKFKCSHASLKNLDDICFASLKVIMDISLNVFVFIAIIAVCCVLNDRELFHLYNNRTDIFRDVRYR